MTTEQEEEELSQGQSRLQDLRKELTAAKQKVIQLQQQIKELEEDIYSKCQHEWKIDRTNVGEHTEYICSKCGGGDRRSFFEPPPKRPTELHT